MTITELNNIIEITFSDYPIRTNTSAILIQSNVGKLTPHRVLSIFKEMRENIGFFEEHRLTEKGLFAMFLVAFNAEHIHKKNWDPSRAEITAAYWNLLNSMQEEECGTRKTFYKPIII